MNVKKQISDYLATQPEPKHDDMQTLYSMMLSSRSRQRVEQLGRDPHHPPRRLSRRWACA